MSFFRYGLNTATRQFIETMCNTESLSKDAEQAWEFLDSLAKNSQVWKIEDNLERKKLIEKSQNRGRLEDIPARLISLPKIVEDWITKKKHAKVIDEVLEICNICDL